MTRGWILKEEWDMIWLNGMSSAIKKCDVFIACVSPEYNRNNSNSNREFIYAVNCGKSILGVRMNQDVDMNEGAYGFYFPQVNIFGLIYRMNRSLIVKWRDL